MIDGFDLTNWPIVYFSNKNNCMNDQYFEVFKESYLNLLVQCKRNKEKIILICDLNNLNENSSSLKYLMKFAQFNKSIYKFNKEFIKGVCLLSTNKCLKDLLNIYFSVAKPACPVKICRSKEKAIKFLKDKCDVTNINTNNILTNNILTNNILNDLSFNRSESPINEDEKESNDDLDEFENNTSMNIFNDTDNYINIDINDFEPDFDKEKYSSLL
jgi:hypothetical protein